MSTDDTKVAGIRTLVKEMGGRVSWGDNDIIAYGGFGEDNYYDLWTINPDGSGAQCLTCNNPKIAQLHNGQPTWHPSGRYIVFQSQDPSLPHDPEFDALYADPLAGRHNNLWAVDPEGKDFYQLTHIKEGENTLHSHFSYDGKKLTWGQRSTVMLADFVEIPKPHLENIQEVYRAPAGMGLETNAFSLDNSKIAISVFYVLGQGRNLRISGSDIWEIDIVSKEVHKFTDNPHTWDEHIHYSPDGKFIVWVSNGDYPYGGETMEELLHSLRLEYWIMNSDGSDRQRLTYFNERGHEHYLGSDYPATAVDYSWSNNSRSFVGCVLRGRARERAQIVVIELE